MSLLKQPLDEVLYHCVVSMETNNVSRQEKFSLYLWKWNITLDYGQPFCQAAQFTELGATSEKKEEKKKISAK